MRNIFCCSTVAHSFPDFQIKWKADSIKRDCIQIVNTDKTDSAWGKVICFQMNSIRWGETNTKSNRAYVTACFSGLLHPSISDPSNCPRGDRLCWPFLLTPFPASAQALQRQHSELCSVHLLPGLLTGLFLTLILLIPGSILDFQALFIPRHLPMVGWPDCTLWWGNWSLLEQLCLAQSSYASPLTALWQSVLLPQHMNLVHSLKSIFAFLGWTLFLHLKSKK